MTTETLDLAEIASLYRCSERHARDIIVQQPGFPEPAPGSTPRHRVWLRAEIRAYLQRKPRKIPESA